MSKYIRTLNQLRGFSDGAGAKAMNPPYMNNPEYVKGYTDGQQAKRTYHEQLSKENGVKFNEIVLMQ